VTADVQRRAEEGDMLDALLAFELRQELPYVAALDSRR
jgi:hypothetical protein